MKTSSTAAIIIFIIGSLTSCKRLENTIEPAENEITDSIAHQKNSRILVYGEGLYVYGEYGSYTGGRDSKYEVTEFDENGLPALAKIDAEYGTGFPGHWGKYKSILKLSYDQQLRITRSEQVFQDLVLATDYSVPDGVTLNPGRNIIQEFEYDGESNRVTRQIRYHLDVSSGKMLTAFEINRLFNSTGQLVKSWNESGIQYEAKFDQYNNPIYQKRGNATQSWDYNYDTSGRIIGRKVTGSSFKEENIYDAHGRLVKQTGNLFIPGFAKSAFPTEIGQLVSNDFDQGNEVFQASTTAPGFPPIIYSYDFQYINGKMHGTNSINGDKVVLNKQGKIERIESLTNWDPGTNNAYFIDEYIYDEFGTYIERKQTVIDRETQKTLGTYGTKPILRYKNF
ncbi:hypothetical protein [Dyadobacter fermentans]|uniref:hypothetical protein n=1 Tax=Dyadobacter fermentans TaxID=94254 RepID=UPI001CC18524|nr:hypothetical protein [Dyadobacter fermentans]MBZ1363026.1 hypothetical protein [Dyadobacter fermentans]